MNTKAKGARAKRRARRMLETQGWTVVRAGASLGPFDLVAFSGAGLCLIQVKVNRIPTRQELARRRLFHNPPADATKEIWRFFARIEVLR